MRKNNDNIPSSPNWNEERLAALKKALPDLFTNEGELNIAELKNLIDPLSNQEQERYEFRWIGKNQAKRTAFSPSTATLSYDASRSVNPQNSENLIIEGENLEVLKLLSSSYREKIKCIYIDPPYNTGKDFVYSDNFTQDKKAYWHDASILENGLVVDTNMESDGRFHSNWLNMLYSRLLISRQLLREDGVIFISIDDNEVHNLRKLCDEVFGADNFISEIIWHSKYTTANDAKFVSRQHEYILFYAKSKENFDIGLLDRTDKMNAAYKNPDNDPRGVWKPTPLHAKSGSSTYTVEFENGVQWAPPKGRYPIYAQKDLLQLYADNRLYFGKNGKNAPDQKSFLTEVKQGKTVGSLWSYTEVGSSHQANEEIATLIGKGIFDNPKTTKLIQTITKTAKGEDALILDFFAGSGTTGHAVMALNQEDGAHRKFILVQIPEATAPNSDAYKSGFKKISDITIERNKRAIEVLKSRYLSENTEGDLGFKVFKLQESNFQNIEFAPDLSKSENENIESLKSYISEKEKQLFKEAKKEDLLTEMLLKSHFTLNFTLKQDKNFTKNEVFQVTDGEKETFICVDNHLDFETVEYFKKHQDSKFICLERALKSVQKLALKEYLSSGFKVF